MNPQQYAPNAAAGGLIHAQSATAFLGSKMDAAPVNALDQHEKSLAVLVDELGDLCARACNVADRMFGPFPESVGKTEATPSNPPVIRRLEDLTNAAHMRVSALKSYLERLERL